MQFITSIGSVPVVMSAEFVPNKSGIEIRFSLIHSEARLADIPKMFPAKCFSFSTEKNNILGREFPSLEAFLEVLGARMVGAPKVTLQ